MEILQQLQSVSKVINSITENSSKFILAEKMGKEFLIDLNKLRENLEYYHLFNQHLKNERIVENTMRENIFTLSMQTLFEIRTMKIEVENSKRMLNDVSLFYKANFQKISRIFAENHLKKKKQMEQKINQVWKTNVENINTIQTLYLENQKLIQKNKEMKKLIQTMNETTNQMKKNNIEVINKMNEKIKQYKEDLIELKKETSDLFSKFSSTYFINLKKFCENIYHENEDLKRNCHLTHQTFEEYKNDVKNTFKMIIDEKNLLEKSSTEWKTNYLISQEKLKLTSDKFIRADSLSKSSQDQISHLNDEKKVQQFKQENSVMKSRIQQQAINIKCIYDHSITISQEFEKRVQKLTEERDQLALDKRIHIDDLQSSSITIDSLKNDILKLNLEKKNISELLENRSLEISYLNEKITSLNEEFSTLKQQQNEIKNTVPNDQLISSEPKMDSSIVFSVVNLPQPLAKSKKFPKLRSSRRMIYQFAAIE